jgi:AcrR family transcriptional regulator
MTKTQKMGLRERQKEDRRARIIAAAQDLFQEAGLDNITIEAIAEIAGVSSVTVHNYYGTKSGVLLALVAESDRELLNTFETDLIGKSDDLIDLVSRFFSIICTHTLTHLDKAIWRQVIAASVNGAEPRFGKLYQELDIRLTGVLIQEIERLQTESALPYDGDPAHLGWALFNLQNARFIEFISSDVTVHEDVLRRLQNDLRALLSWTTPQSPVMDAGPAGSRLVGST